MIKKEIQREAKSVRNSESWLDGLADLVEMRINWEWSQGGQIPQTIADDTICKGVLVAIDPCLTKNHRKNTPVLESRDLQSENKAAF